MQREPGEPEPADEFDRIVSGWRREQSVPAWPHDAEVDDPPGDEPEPAPPAQPPPVDEGHFAPPDPPPLPPVGPPALVGLALLVLGVVLLGAPWWIGIPDAYGLPLGLVTLAAGLGWLVLRLWPDPPRTGDGDGEDDGAVL
ncbi:MAG: hypothetical protein ACT4RN_10640 [Pseudonocardia sp.]